MEAGVSGPGARSGAAGRLNGGQGEVDAATRAHFTARAVQYSGGSEGSLQAILELAAPRTGERVLDVATGTGLVLFALAARVGAARSGVGRADDRRSGKRGAPAGGLAIGVDFTPAMLAEAVRRRAGTTGTSGGTAGDAPGEAQGRAGTTEGDAAGTAPPVAGGDASGTAPAANGTAEAAVLIAAHATQLPFRPASFDVVTCRFAVHHFADPSASLAAMAGALRPGGRLVIADFVCPVDPAAAARQDRLERLRGHVYVEIFTQPRLQEMLAAAGCPVTTTRTSPRELRPQEWLASPNLPPESRTSLVEMIDDLTAHGGAGLEVRQVDGETRFLRQDAVLLGVKSG